LSEDGRTPSAVARLLCDLGWGESRLTVFERLGGPAEAAIAGAAHAWGNRDVADLNTIALECVAGPQAQALPLIPGLPDDAFEHDGQLTKREVRAATLAALAPLPGQVLWDVGAGCGSVAIEWLRTGAGARAVAIERDRSRAAIIARNAAGLGVPVLEIVTGEAPQALASIPADFTPPDAVFVGGGITQADLLPSLWRLLRPGGRLVANVVSLEGERVLLDWQARDGGSLTRLAVSRAEPLGAQSGWRPLMPVTQLAAAKPF
jgi:precorrin-6Y C5,15-methyltransferase (decarboxylating)